MSLISCHVVILDLDSPLNLNLEVLILLIVHLCGAEYQQIITVEFQQ